MEGGSENSTLERKVEKRRMVEIAADIDILNANSKLVRESQTEFGEGDGNRRL